MTRVAIFAALVGAIVGINWLLGREFGVWSMSARGWRAACFGAAMVIGNGVWLLVAWIVAGDIEEMTWRGK